MDIVDTRANLVGVAVVLEGVEKLHVTLRSLNGNDVSIQALDGGENVIEVRVAEVGVSLELISDAGSGEFEGVNSPLEVGVPVSTTEGELCKED